MTKSKGILAPRRLWSDEDVEIIRKQYPNSPTKDIAEMLGRPLEHVYRKAHHLGLKKSAEYLAGPHACRLRRGDKVGAAFRFPKGHTPINKGVKGWQAGGRSADTRFKKGHLPHTWRPVGTERLSKEGYLQRKLTDTGITRRDYVPVHHIIWREAGREIPKGYRLTFKDGNKQHIVLNNLELVSIADLMRRNTYHNYGKDIAQLVQLRGAVTRQINRRMRDE